MRQFFEIDKEGQYIAPVIIESIQDDAIEELSLNEDDLFLDEETGKRYLLNENIVIEEFPSTLFVPVWREGKWEEGRDPEEIKELQKPKDLRSIDMIIGQNLTDFEIQSMEQGQQVTDMELESLFQGQQITDMEIERLMQAQAQTDLDLRLLELEAKLNV